MKILFLILLLHLPVFSQTYLSQSRKDYTTQPQQYQIPNYKDEWCNTKCKLSIAAYITGAGLDTYSSIGHKELNPLWRTKDGRFNTVTNSLYKLGILGLTFWKQDTKPNRMAKIRFLGGILFGTMGTINLIRSHN